MKQENKRKIILIDDNAILRTIFGYMLEEFSAYPIEFHAFKNALDALDFFDHHVITESTPAPILFVDINMPFMTGWEMMDALEDKADFIERTRIFIISSSSSRTDQEQLANYPFIQGFILKPFDKKRLYNILNETP